MRTFKYFLFGFILFFSAQSFASENDIDESNIAVAENVIKYVKSQATSQGNLNGLVLVSFTVDDKGYIHVEDVISPNQSLKMHVRKALHNKKINTDTSTYNKSYKVTLRYALQVSA